MLRLYRLAVRDVLIGSVALTLAGCGTTTMTSARGSSTPPASVVAKALPPQQRARADAASILAAFVPPPGAQRLASPPSGVGGKLDHQEFTSGDPDVVYSAALWAVPGMSPLQVLAWEKTHLPGRFRLGLVSGEAAPAPSLPPGTRPVPSDPYHYASNGFDLPSGEEMIVQAARSLAGQTYVRVNAEVAWQPQRAASERVPGGVSAITITAQPDPNKPRESPAPVTVTSPAKVGEIVTLLDSLPMDPGGLHGCPMETGKGITLSFLRQANGPALATASEPIPSCGDIRFAIRGAYEPGLSDWGSLTQKVLSIAGVRWPGFNAPG